MYFRAVEPMQLGDVIREVERDLRESGDQIAPSAALYAEKRGSFQCGTCCYVTPVNATHGKCQLLTGSVHLDEGVCVMWSPDRTQLHLYREP